MGGDNEEDDQSVCDICRSNYDEDERDRLVYCELCNVATH